MRVGGYFKKGAMESMIKRLYLWYLTKTYEYKWKRSFQKMQKLIDAYHGCAGCESCIDNGEYPCQYSPICGPEYKERRQTNVEESIRGESSFNQSGI